MAAVAAINELISVISVEHQVVSAVVLEELEVVVAHDERHSNLSRLPVRTDENRPFQRGEGGQGGG